MKKNIFSISFLFLTLLLFFSNCSQKSDHLDDSLLWKISGNGLVEPSYILGINNLLDANLLDSIPGLEDSFNKTNQYVGEFIVLPEDKTLVNDSIYQSGIIALGSGYHNILSNDTYLNLDKALKSVYNESVEDVKNIHPSLLLSRYFLLLAYRTNPNNNLICEETMNESLQNRAVDKELNLISLETIDNRISFLFDSVSMKKNVDVLIEALDNVDQNVTFMKNFSSLYKKQSLSKIYDLYAGNNANKPSLLFKKQLDLAREQNVEWVKELGPIMQKNSSFIAVGVVHLIGEDGLLSLLKKEGYTVEPIK